MRLDLGVSFTSGTEPWIRAGLKLDRGDKMQIIIDKLYSSKQMMLTQIIHVCWSCLSHDFDTTTKL